LVHAYSEKALSEDNTPIDVERSITSFVAKQKELFKRAAESAGLPELSVRSVIAEGDPREVMKYKVAKREADLLVLGTRGRRGITRALLGSVTTDLINERLCDVLVIRPE
jgi:nucleotide-binding universal stress UspA family protein